MSSNTSDGPAFKGSKRAMQSLSSVSNTGLLNEILDDKLEWISPREKDNYKEYQMNNSFILNALGIAEEVKNEYFTGWWPTRQPQWDGIALGKDKSLYLFEAKSRCNEIARARKGKSQINNEMKYGSIMTMASKLFGVENIESNGDVWCYKYYQISNRIAFQQRLIEISKAHNTNFEDVKMVFLNFVNDRTWEAEKQMVCSGEKWDDHYDKILRSMGVTRGMLSEHGIKLVNFDLDQLIR